MAFNFYSRLVQTLILQRIKGLGVRTVPYRIGLILPYKNVSAVATLIYEEKSLFKAKINSRK